MTVDLDALEVRANTRQAIDSPDVLALIDELRQERERAAEAWRIGAAQHGYDPTDDEQAGNFMRLAKRADRAEAALSRAEEAIEKALDHDPLHGKPEGLHCGGMSPCIRGILTEYGKQKSTPAEHENQS